MKDLKERFIEMMKHHDRQPDLDERIGILRNELESLSGQIREFLKHLKN